MRRLPSPIVPILLVALTCVARDAFAQPARAAESTAAGPRAAVATPADYVIGAEDVLSIDVWKEADISGETRVLPDGTVNLKVIGPMAAAGLSLEAFSEQVQQAAAKYVNEPTVTVTVRELNSRKVYITGEVENPNAYPLAGPRTVMQLIALAGGLTEYAKKSEITISREEGGKLVQYKFNYNDFAKGKRLEQNIKLRPGDVVNVP
jgi:polysaccharide biosynthesis/export protein